MPIRFVGLVLAVLHCVALLTSSGVYAQQAQDDDPVTTLQTLLTKRRDALRERLEFVRAMHQNGSADWQQVASARHLVLEAELELASTQKERFELRRQMIEGLRELEQVAAQRHRDGSRTIEELLLARASRLQAEIELEREKLNASKQEKGPDKQKAAPGASQQTPQAADESAHALAAKTYPVWVGEWELSRELHKALGYDHEDALAEWPISFRLSFSSTIGDGIDADVVLGHRALFERIEHRVVATGNWKLTFQDASRVNEDSEGESSCFVTEHGGSTFLWVPVPYAIFFGGKISFLEGSETEHDAIVIDFNSMPDHVAGVVRASQTAAYKRRAVADE